MLFGENLKQAYISLTSNKLRSILTMLGIAMGVFSVVAIMAISNAAKVFMSGEFNKLGADTIFVQYAGDGENPAEMLTMKDMELIADGIEEVRNITAAQVFNSSIRVEDGTRTAQVIGTTSQYPSFQILNMSEGRFLSAADIDGQRQVAVVTDTYAKEYFGTNEILGEEIWVYNDYDDIMKVKVVGVLNTEDAMFGDLMAGIELPVQIYLPITSTQTFFDDKYLDQIQVSVSPGYDMASTASKMVRLLEFVHQTEDKYYATSVEEIQRSINDVLNVVSLIFLVIAIITLFVGGIGIINILLVSVTERIREIGLRKAIGARKRDIVLQFLTESIMMTGFSGLLGITLGVITGAIISNTINIPPVVDIKIILITFFGSVILGLIFGVYPAKKAADLDPIDSLRYE